MNLFRQRIHLVNSKLWSEWFRTVSRAPRIAECACMCVCLLFFLSCISSPVAHRFLKIIQSLNWMTTSVWRLNKNYRCYCLLAHCASLFSDCTMFLLCLRWKIAKNYTFSVAGGAEQWKRKILLKDIQVDITRNGLYAVHNCSTESEWSAEWMKFEFREFGMLLSICGLIVWRLRVLCRDSFRFSWIHLNFDDKEHTMSLHDVSNSTENNHRAWLVKGFYQYLPILLRIQPILLHFKYNTNYLLPIFHAQIRSLNWKIWHILCIATV